jgi:hypothetical protein
MSLLTTIKVSRARRSRCAASPQAAAVVDPLPASLRRRIQLSSDVLAALLKVEGRDRPTLDDIEWADAVAAQLTQRLAARRMHAPAANGSD